MAHTAIRQRGRVGKAPPCPWRVPSRPRGFGGLLNHILDLDADIFGQPLRVVHQQSLEGAPSFRQQFLDLLPTPGPFPKLSVTIGFLVGPDLCTPP